VEGRGSRWPESLPSDAASFAHDASPFPAGARRSPEVALTGQSLLRCSRPRRFAALVRGSRRRLLALRLCRGLIQSSRAGGAVVIASPNRSCPAQRSRECNHRHYRPPPIATPATRGFDRCCRVRVRGQQRRTQRWRLLLRLPCSGRWRRRLAGVDRFRARPFGQFRIDERQFWTERLDRESVPGVPAEGVRDRHHGRPPWWSPRSGQFAGKKLQGPGSVPFGGRHGLVCLRAPTPAGGTLIGAMEPDRCPRRCP